MASDFGRRRNSAASFGNGVNILAVRHEGGDWAALRRRLPRERDRPRDFFNPRGEMTKELPRGTG